MLALSSHLQGISMVKGENMLHLPIEAHGL
jgi:hypothetical protein